MDLLILLKAKLSTPDQVHKKTPSLGWGFILFLSVDPERFELSVSTLIISVYGAFSLAKFLHFEAFSNKTLLQFLTPSVHLCNAMT